MPFYYVEEVMTYVFEYLDLHKEELGINHVGYGDEELIPGWPAIQVAGEPDDREIKATQQFRRTFNLSIFVFHADLSINHRIRTQEDMELATAVVKKLHEDYTLGGNIIFGYVTNSSPGVVLRGNLESPQEVVSTRLVWTGQGTEPFQHA